MSSGFTILLDANVIYGQYLRSFMMFLAQTRIVRFKWTERILDECFENLKKRRPDIDPAKFDRTKSIMMTQVLQDALVTDFEAMEAGLELPDPDDRHVLAAAIKCGAQTIVTFNTKDFPTSALQTWGIEAMRPDEFVLDLLDLSPLKVEQATMNMQRSLLAPPMEIGELLDLLSRDGLTRSTEALRERLDQID